MQLTDSPRAEGIRRLYELMLRVNSSTDLSEVLDEIARGVVEVLGYGIAAIARLEGETFVMTTVAGPEEVREQIIGRRTPVASMKMRTPLRATAVSVSGTSSSASNCCVSTWRSSSKVRSTGTSTW